MTARRASKPALDSFTEIATLRIDLKDSEPPIWRQVEVPTSITLKVLHAIVQVTMGWLDCHLREFRTGGTTYGLPMDEDWGTAQRKSADRTRLRDVIGPGVTTIDYIYDFGDSWEHLLTISDVRTGDTAIGYPRFVDGERDCPPEDCGGIPGSTRCSTPVQTLLIPTMRRSSSGWMTTTPKPSTHSRSKSRSPASPHDATPPQSASSNRHRPIGDRRGLHRMDTFSLNRHCSRCPGSSALFEGRRR